MGSDVGDDLELLGKRLRDLRVRKKLSQEKLSELSGVSSRHISEMERGESNPSYQVLRHLSQSLGVPLGVLLEFEHHKDNSELIDGLVEKLKTLPPARLQLVYRVLAVLLE